MRVTRLWISDFRNYTSAELAPAPDGLTVVTGANGEGKTNLLEAIAYLATLESFRGAPNEAMVRQGCEAAIVRAEADRGGRALLIEAELPRSGAARAQVNRQKLRRSRDLLGALRVSVFSPDDLDLVKGGPAGRRRYVDEAVIAAEPAHDRLRSDLERVLRQRNTLLRQAGGRLTSEIEVTLDVWDDKLAAVGESLVSARESVVARVEPELQKAYDQVAGMAAEVQAVYHRSWAGSLADALVAARADDVRRGVSTVGPHRDELELVIGGLPARTHGSQGEQRSLALALRLAAHAVVSDAAGSAPVLLLDDVFSELDPDRSEALVAHLPAGQALLTTATPPPASIRPAATVVVAGGRLREPGATP